MNIVRIGNKITVIISPTEIYQKDNLSEEEVSDLFAISMEASPNLDIVRQIMNPDIFRIRAENEQKQATIDAINEGFENSKLVYMLEGSAYMYGINLSMPQILAERIITLEPIVQKQISYGHHSSDESEELEGLINFWKRCALNPNPKARQDLFKFITDRDFPITKHGYFLSYRRAWKTDKNKTENPELHDFVLKSYVKIKQQKKSPKSYHVYMSVTDKTYKYALINDSSEEFRKSIGSEGNLAELYDKFTTVSDEQVSYTDNRTKTFDIRIGVPVVMERRLGDSNPEIECSAGLHTGSIDYMNRNEWLGDTILALLINPLTLAA